jgi:hypothetical protein
MLDWNECPAVERVSGKVSGAWLFKATRVPVTALFENLDLVDLSPRTRISVTNSLFPKSSPQ